MAIDFSLMPSEAPLPEKAPSPFIWSLLFVVLCIVGAATALRTWPHHTSTQNARFWFQVVVLPVCVSGTFVLQRFLSFYHRRNRIRADNRARRAYRELVYEVASEPLAVLDYGFRIDANPDRNLLEAFRARSANPPTRIAKISRETIVASYLEPKETELTFDDNERQAALLDWIFREFMPSVLSIVERLPSGFRFEVHFDINSAVLTRDAVVSIWTKLSKTVLPSRLRVEPTFAPTHGLWMIDSMLDRTEPSASRTLTLLISCNLNALYTEDPLRGSTESASMLLLCSPLLAKKHGLPVKSWLHRPQSTRNAPNEGAVHYGLKWARATGGAIAGVVHGGLDEDATIEVRQALIAEGYLESRGSRILHLESFVGHTGLSTPWLATSIALTQASLGNALNVVAVSDNEDMLFVVVAPPEHHDHESDSET